VELRAGPLTADVDGGDIRGIAVHGVEVVQRVYLTVRDEEWRTAATVVRGTTSEAGRGGFGVRIEGESVLAGRTVAVWRLHATGTAAGALEADLQWRATERFWCNRIGLCVHHPTARWAGAAWRTRLAGADAAGRLDALVMPQPVIAGEHRPAVGPFETLLLETDGAWTSLSSPDEPFELEDQRNWGDASYKSYSSPIPREPRLVAPGETGRTRIRLSAGADRRPAPAAPSLCEAGTFPAVSAGMPAVVMVGEEPAGAAIAALRASPPARVVLTTPAGPPAGRAAVAALQHAIEPIPAGAGTVGSFSELNRCRDDLQGAGSLTWSLDPQVHATDDRSIMENVAAVRDQLATAAAIVPGAERHLAVDLAHGRDDPRRGTPFEAAWLVGVVAHATGGAASILVPQPAGKTAGVVARMREWQGAPAVMIDDPRGRVAGVGVRRPAGVELLLANLTPRRVAFAATGRRLALVPYEVRSVTASA